MARVIWLIPKQDIPINVLTMTKSVYSHTTEIAATVTESEAIATLMAHENLGPSFLLWPTAANTLHNFYKLYGKPTTCLNLQASPQKYARQTCWTKSVVLLLWPCRTYWLHLVILMDQELLFRMNMRSLKYSHLSAKQKIKMHSYPLFKQYYM